MEVEFVALELTCQEAEWLKNLLVHMPLWERKPMAIPLHCDLQAAIGIAHNSLYNRKERHICIRYSAVKHMLKHSVISLEYDISRRNLADPLTYGLAR